MASEEHHSNINFNSDQPIKSREKDLLGRSGFAESMARSIANYSDSDNLVIGLYGGWGNGKTSIKNMIVEYLNDMRNNETESAQEIPAVMEFNPWLWSGRDQMIGEFFRELASSVKEIVPKEEKENTSNNILNLGTFLTASKVTTTTLSIVSRLAGIPIAHEALKGVQNLIRILEKEYSGKTQDDSPTLSELRKRIKESLDNADRHLLVIMDDIDRLTKDEIQVLFQLIKVNADFPNIIYLVLCDREVVATALGEKVSAKGDDYLEKIIQVPMDIPVSKSDDIEQLFNEEILVNLGNLHEDRMFERERFNRISAIGIYPLFSNYREIKRFASSFSFVIGQYRRDGFFEINIVDLIGIELIRYYSPEIYQKIFELRYFITRTEFSEPSNNTINKLFDRIHKIEKDQIIDLIYEIFPLILDADGVAFSVASKELEDRENKMMRISNFDNIDKYFQFAIPDTEIPQSQVIYILDNATNIPLLNQAFAEIEIRNWLISSLNKIYFEIKEIKYQSLQPFMLFLIDRQKQWLPDYTLVRQLVWINYQMIMNIAEENDRFELAYDVLVNTDNLIMKVEILITEDSIKSDAYRGHCSPILNDEQSQKLENQLLIDLKKVVFDVTNISDYIYRYVLYWDKNGDQSDLKLFLIKATKTAASAIMLLIQWNKTLDWPDPERKRDYELLEKYINLDELNETLHSSKGQVEIDGIGFFEPKLKQETITRFSEYYNFWRARQEQMKNNVNYLEK